MVDLTQSLMEWLMQRLMGLFYSYGLGALTTLDGNEKDRLVITLVREICVYFRPVRCRAPRVRSLRKRTVGATQTAQHASDAMALSPLRIFCKRRFIPGIDWRGGIDAPRFLGDCRGVSTPPAFLVIELYLPHPLP